jgi:hypothetical protein
MALRRNRPWFPARVGVSRRALPDLPLFLVQVSSVSSTSSPVTRAAERRALRRAVAGHAGDAAHGARQPPIVELQGTGQVGACPGVSAVPFGSHGGQFPDGVDVAGPAVRELVAAVVLAEHGVGPAPQVSQLGVVGVAIQADPVGCGGSARGSGSEGVGDGLGQLVETGGQIQVGVQPGLIEPFVESV